MPDKIKIKSDKTGLEQEMTQDEFNKLQSVVGAGKHTVVSSNTTPAEVQRIRAAKPETATKPEAVVDQAPEEKTK